jgi:Mn2+/Fe2+ NRAMP family transporter
MGGSTCQACDGTPNPLALSPKVVCSDRTDLQADTIMSLLGFALTINSSILILAGAAFLYQGSNSNSVDVDLFGAHALIKDYI